MAHDWFETTIGDQATLQRGVDITKANQRPGIIPVISSGGVSSYHDIPAATGPGVILGRKGVVGSVYFVTSDYWPHDTTLWVKDFHGNDRRFVYYFFRWLAPLIASMDVGSANPTLNRNHVHPIEIKWPRDNEEQRVIAHILGTLDDKIALNGRMSGTLEAIARTLFQSWFVNFDPVHAKFEGRDPGLPRDIADLFPNRFVESELGEIPEGWEILELGECLALLKDGSHNPPKRVEEGIPFLAGATDIKHFSIDFTKCTFISEADYGDIHRRWKIQAGDVLLTIVGTVGNVAIVGPHDLPFSLQRSIAVLRPGPGITSSFLYCMLQSDVFRAAIKARLNPTAQPGIYLGTLAKIPLCFPKKDVMLAFDKAASVVFTRMQNLNRESHVLIAQRDALLPKLITGELRVKNA